MSGIDTGTRGMYYFDAFESRKDTAIGAEPEGEGLRLMDEKEMDFYETITAERVAYPFDDPFSVFDESGKLTAIEESSFDLLMAESSSTIAYVYDPLSRLTEANYSDGRYLHYVYDSNGNRLLEESCLEPDCLSVTTEYEYDNANRLVSVNEVSYTWDDNGNLLSDGVYTYTYDSLNRLTSMMDGISEIEYGYNGRGDMIEKVEDAQSTQFTLDLASGLTQVLWDGTTTYLYGNARLGQDTGSGMQFYLTDALGSVRQVADDTSIILTKEYEPYGEVVRDEGWGQSDFGFTGEWTSPYNEFVYLRARWYAPGQGRFLTRDMWEGSQIQPMSYNTWLYTYANPVNLTDPSGLKPITPPFPPIIPPPPNPLLYLPSVCLLLHRNLNTECLDICENALNGTDWSYVGKRRISGYFVVYESQFTESDGYGSYTVEINGEQVTANERFLFRNDGVCMQGTGRLENGNYISCTDHVNWRIADGNNLMPHKEDYDNITFSFASRPTLPRYSPFKTVARWSGDMSIQNQDTLFIPSLVGYLSHWDPSFQGGLLTATDTGGGLGYNEDFVMALDLFLGEDQPYGRIAFTDLKNCLAEYPNSSWYVENPDICEARPVIYRYVDVYKWNP